MRDGFGPGTLAHAVPEEITDAEINAAQQEILAAMEAGEDLWVFAYGSLMWNPGFAFAKRCEGTLYGYHRSFCVYSHHYRGTLANPGLVLGLNRGGSCRGVSYRVAREKAEDAVAYLWRREMLSRVYLPKKIRVRLGDATVDARTFVANRAHRHYAGGLSPDETARLIRRGVGAKGRCSEYLANTVEHLNALGIDDGPLHRLREMVCGPMAEGVDTDTSAQPQFE
ncbi:MAG: gamma-glutamylcyclotransferase [Alphaproteobacteria bacterium]